MPARRGSSRSSAPPHSISTSLLPKKSVNQFLVPYKCQETGPKDRCAHRLIGICFPRETTTAILIQVYPPATERSKIKISKASLRRVVLFHHMAGITTKKQNKWKSSNFQTASFLKMTSEFTHPKKLGNTPNVISPRAAKDT